jgi:hypothetical protein
MKDDLIKTVFSKSLLNPGYCPQAMSSKTSIIISSHLPTLTKTHEKLQPETCGRLFAKQSDQDGVHRP